MRPLIELTKNTIKNLCDENNLKYNIDSSNKKNKYSRNKIRNKIIPEIEKINPNFLKSINSLSEIVNDNNNKKKIKFGNLKDLSIVEGIEILSKKFLQIMPNTFLSKTHYEMFEKILLEDKDHKIKAVLVTHNETSTGVTNDVKATRDLLNNLNHPALLFVDGVSSIGSIKFEMDAWGVDVAVSGSQKGFMLPAGLAISCVSQKALEIAKTSNLPRAYYDYHDMLKINETGYWPYTNPMPLLRGLREALNMMMEEGIDNIYERHKFLAQAVQKASNAWGLKLCAKDPSLYSNTVTAIMVPEGIDSTDVVKTAYNKYNTSFGGGLNKVAGKLFRIGHLGDLNSTMILGAISTAELAMYDVGIKFELGSGVAAAIKHLKA